MNLSRIAAVVTLIAAVVTAPAPVARDGSAFAHEPTAPAVDAASEVPSTRDRLARIARALPVDEADAIVSAVDRHAVRFDLDPAMVLAVIHVESRFDRTAVSSRGAIGLMQLRPTTAREVAGWLDVEWSGADALTDPDLNILLGTCYLRSLVNRFDDEDVALAAYNAGPTRVAARHRRTGEVPRTYARRVRRALRSLSADGGPPLDGRIS